MPAEWEPHEATWLAWPHAVGDWPGRFGPIPWAFADLVKKLTAGETVRLLVNDAVHEAGARRKLRSQGVDLGRVDFLRIPTDRSWMRDSGPIFLRKGAGLVVAGFRFGAWSRYPDWRRDRRVPARAAKGLGLPLLPVRRLGRDVVLEGGAIDVNGAGSILATEECLLDPAVQVRNPGFGRSDYEAIFRDVLSAPCTSGSARASPATTPTATSTTWPGSSRPPPSCWRGRTTLPTVNHAALSENRERLASARLADGSRPEVIDLPMPRPVAFGGRRLPASYANFYVANAAVLVPTFNDPADHLALGILGELFRDRPVVGVHALDLVWGLGTLHCLTQQEPAA